jgi:hypothetical protein
MTSKVLEADAGIHSLGMAVAPVVSWRMYDSIYTERYMGTPQKNEGGYFNSSITNVTGFNHADFLLAHGSGDDNGASSDPGVQMGNLMNEIHHSYEQCILRTRRICLTCSRKTPFDGTASGCSPTARMPWSREMRIGSCMNG